MDPAADANTNVNVEEVSLAAQTDVHAEDVSLATHVNERVHVEEVRPAAQAKDK